jgi:Na+/melibiose symporter-like transporter
MLAGSLTILPTFALIWMSPFTDPESSSYFVLVMFSICTISFSCFLIPFFALNAELPRDYHDRTALNSYRTAYTMIGAVLAGAGAPLVVQFVGGGRNGYMAMGLGMGAIMAIVTFVSFISAREPARHEDEKIPTLRQTLDAITGNKPYIYLFTAYFIHITSVGLFGAVLAYFVTYVLKRDADFLSLLFFLTYGASIAAIPFWVWLSKKVGKFRSFQSCIGLLIVSSVAYAFVTANTSMPILLAIVILNGLSGGAVQVFSFSMLADCIQHGNKKPGVLTSAAMFNGVFIAGEKLGFASGALLSGIIFAVAGLVETTKGSVMQPESAITGIRVAISLVPAALNVVAITVVSFYSPFERELLAAEAAPRPAE